MFIFYLIMSLLLGLVLGSFMNVLVYRLPREMSIVTPGSSCTSCGAPVRWYSNIPVLSYLAQRGRCRDCGARISIQYPLVELICGLLFAAVFLKFGMSILTVKYFCLVFLLLGAAFTDLFTALDTEKFESGVIPNFYTIGGAFIGLIWALFTQPGFLMSLAGAGAGVFVLLIPGYIYAAIKGREGIGDGDALLLGMIGTFLGTEAVLFVFTAGAVLGVLAGLVVVIISKNRYIRFPFGPALAAAAILYIFFSPYIDKILF